MRETELTSAEAVDRQELADRLLQENREEISRADAKASTILAGTGIGAGALLAGLLAGDWSPTQLHNQVEWVWWLGIAVAVYAMVRLAQCILPVRNNGEASDHIDYYGDITKFSSSEELASALQSEPPDLYGRTVRQTFVTAGIAERKYQHLRTALLALGWAAGLVTVSVLVNLAS